MNCLALRRFAVVALGMGVCGVSIAHDDSGEGCFQKPDRSFENQTASGKQCTADGGYAKKLPLWGQAVGPVLSASHEALPAKALAAVTATRAHLQKEVPLSLGYREPISDLEALLGVLQENLSQSPPKLSADMVAVSYWSPGGLWAGHETGRLDLSDLVRETDCDSDLVRELNDSCRQQLRALEHGAVGLYVVSKVVEALTKHSAEEIRKADLALHQKWGSHLFSGMFSYPWELAFNHCFNKPDRDTGNEGTPEPPDGRWIFLHPDVGLIFTRFRQLRASDELDLALTLLPIGYQWSGKFDSDKGKYPNPFGVSLATAWKSTEGAQDYGAGVAIHYRGYTVNAIKFGGDGWGVSVSVSLGQAIEELSGKSQGERVKDYMDRLKNRSN